MILRPQPSLQMGYARGADESAYPQFWEDNLVMLAPFLGVAGNDTFARNLSPSRVYGNFDLIGNNPGPPTWSMGPHGMSLRFDKDTAWTGPRCVSERSYTLSRWSSTGFTIAMCLSYWNTVATGKLFSLGTGFGLSPVGTNRVDLVGMTGLTNAYLQLNPYANAGTNRLLTVVATYDPVTTTSYLRTLAGGQPSVTTATHTGTLSNITNSLTIGNDTGGDSQDINLYAAYFWERAFDVKHQLMLMNDPWAPFRLNYEPWTYSEQAAAPAGTTPMLTLTGAG